MARPLKKVDTEAIKKLAQLHCTYDEIAEFSGVSTKTLQRHYVHLIKKGRQTGKISLRRAPVTLLGIQHSTTSVRQVETHPHCYARCKNADKWRPEMGRAEKPIKRKETPYHYQKSRKNRNANCRAECVKSKACPYRRARPSVAQPRKGQKPIQKNQSWMKPT